MAETIAKIADDGQTSAGAARFVLVVNLGSSSAKFSLFRLLDQGGLAEDPYWTNTVALDCEASDDAVLGRVQTALEPVWSQNGLSLNASSIVAVGHRIVHGGIYSASALINEKVKQDIVSFEKYAPIHNRLNLIGIQALENLLGSQIKQVAVFDTTFHHTIPETVARYALPYNWYEQYGFRRYGFHGISHAYAAYRAAQMLNVDPGAFTGIICHLGSGCSVTAVQNGKSVDTSMGFTPLEGLIMGTRSGSVDPGLILHLLHEPGMTVDAISHALNFESGLSGVSGLPNEMKVIVAEAVRGNERAELALTMFVYRLQSYIGAYYVHLKEPKALVFTGGIGEHCPDIRERTVDGLGKIGCVLDRSRSRKVGEDADISDPSAQLRVLVVRAREDLFIAREALKLENKGVDSLT